MKAYIIICHNITDVQESLEFTIVSLDSKRWVFEANTKEVCSHIKFFYKKLLNV